MRADIELSTNRCDFRFGSGADIRQNFADFRPAVEDQAKSDDSDVTSRRLFTFGAGVSLANRWLGIPLRPGDLLENSNKAYV
jgi:hypothetical protein